MQGGQPMEMQPGLTAIETHTIQGKDLATHWGSEMPVLASPVLIGLFELACVKATDHLLESTHTTVGVGFDVMHISPTPIGSEVQVTASLEAVEGSKLTFHVEAYDADGLISTGVLHRAVVKKETFLERV